MGGAGANTTLGLCTCAKGYFNTSRGTRCHSGDYSATVPVAASLGCETCDNLECATECHGELLIIAAGWTLETHTDDSISIFQCQYTGACPGGTVLRNDSTCSEGYSGRLCGACDKNYTLASDGECTPCGTGTWLGIALAIVGVVVLAAAATKVRLLFNYFTLLQGAAGLISDLQVKPIAKIIVALGQIVGGLDGVLNVSMPAIFRYFMASFMSVFKFDITLAIGLGCFSDGDYLTSLFVNFAMVIVVALLVGAIYAFQMIQLIRNPPRNDSPKGKERLQKLFAWFDKDGDGIDFAEVQKFVEKIDPSVSKAEAMALFRRADADGSGIIDYQEFSDVMSGTPLDLGKLVKSNAVSNADHVRKLFQQFDDDGDGKIDLEEIRAIAEEIDPSISAEDVAAIFQKADTDGSGAIDFDEFFAAITSPAMDLRVFVKKAEKADITATALGRLFLLGFLLYPGRRMVTLYTPILVVLELVQQCDRFLTLECYRAGMTAKIFQVFACRQVGLDESVLHADYNVDCSATMALRWGGGGFLVLLWPIGLPTGLFFAIHRVRQKILDEDEDTL
jgi:Ca2+-binding EF-hand superfamily protein